MEQKKPTGKPTGNISPIGRSPLGFWWISALIIVVIFGIEYFYSDQSRPKDITWNEFFDTVLPSGEVKEVVIYNKEVANVYLTSEALKSDKYKDLPKAYGKALPPARSSWCGLSMRPISRKPSMRYPMPTGSTFRCGWKNPIRSGATCSRGFR